MKTRNGFVSNSSSSSYAVIPQHVVDEFNNAPEVNMVESFNRLKLSFDFSQNNDWNGLFDDGERNFQWQIYNYRDTESKWNWLVLQAIYGDDSYKRVLDKFLNSINEYARIDWDGIKKMSDDFEVGIDHQSIDAKDTFEKVELIGIDEFLVNPMCYVHNSNDNYGDDEEE